MSHRLRSGKRVSTLSLAETYQRLLQPARKLLIHASNLTQQSVNRHPESPRKFDSVQLPDQGTFELRSHCAWQQVHAAAMDGRKAVTNAGQRKRVVADTADHVFRLP